VPGWRGNWEGVIGAGKVWGEEGTRVLGRNICEEGGNGLEITDREEVSYCDGVGGEMNEGASI